MTADRDRVIASSRPGQTAANSGFTLKVACSNACAMRHGIDSPRLSQERAFAFDVAGCAEYTYHVVSYHNVMLADDNFL